MLAGLAGCGGAERSPAPGEGVFEEAGAAVLATAAQLAPGDTASLLTVMRETMVEIDAALEGMTRRDTVLTDPTNGNPVHLTLWLHQGSPRKLVAGRTPAGDMIGEESAFWFVDDELRVALLPDEGFFLEADRMLLWTDAGLDPVRAVDPTVRMERESALIAEVGAWLTQLGVGPPIP